MSTITYYFPKGVIQYLYLSGKSYISLTKNVSCWHKYGEPQQHEDIVRSIFAVQEEFFMDNGLVNASKGSKEIFMGENIQHFSFQNTNQIKFHHESVDSITLIKNIEFCPSDSLYQAIMAAHVINMLKQSNFSKIVEGIQNLWSEQDLKNKSPISQISAIRAKSIFKGMFQFQQGLNNEDSRYYLNRNVFSQSRLIDGALEEFQEKNRIWMVYHPTSITSQIFNLTAKDYVQQARRSMENIYIHGQGGLGKSTSFSLLVGLHNFIDNFKHFYQLNKSKKLRYLKMSNLEISQVQQLITLPKYFYFNLSQRPFRVQELFVSLKEQLPIELQFLTLRGQISDINSLFKQYSGRLCILIIDQINILFSSIRKVKTQKAYIPIRDQQIIHSIQNMLNELPARIRLIYGSSENAELSLINQMPYNLRTHQLRFSKNKVHHLHKQLNLQNIQEIVSIIQFQNINMIIKKKIQCLGNVLQEKRFEYSIIKDALKQQTVPLFLQEFNHERVKQYFSNTKDNQHDRMLDNNNIQGFFSLIDRMYQFMVDQLSNKYKDFVQKGKESTQLIKYRMLTKIRIEAFKLSQRQDEYLPFFQYQTQQRQFGEFQPELIFKDHVEIDKDRLIIFISPSAFIHATRFLEKNPEFLCQLVKRFVNDFGDQPDWFGKTVEGTFINLIYRQQKVSLKIGEEQLMLDQKNNADFIFGHFMRMVTQNEKKEYCIMQNFQITKEICIEARFDDLWDLMDQQKVKLKRFICAKPCAFQKGVLQRNKASSNSQVIDLLLIKKVEEWQRIMQKPNNGVIIYQQFELKTFDFCMAFTRPYIQDKTNTAFLFLTKFMKVAQKEALQFHPRFKKEMSNGYQTYTKRSVKHITHVIVLPKVMLSIMSCEPIISKGFTIVYVAVEEMKVWISEQDNLIKAQNDLRRQLLRALMEAVEIKSKN